MKQRLRHEWQQLRTATRSLDRQTVFVLTMYIVFVIVQYKLGNRRFFRTELAAHVAEDWRGLLSWGWWFAVQGVTGFVLPVLALIVLTLLAVIALFWRVRKLAGALLLPYLAWVLFASVLNYQFLQLNPEADGGDANGAVERVRIGN